MAVVFIAHNGIGLGHLSRSLALAEHLLRRGVPPVVYSQGSLPDFVTRRLPAKRVPLVRLMTESERSDLVSEIAAYAGISRPAVVLEDTHPVNLTFPPSIRRILVVRPTTWKYLQGLNAKYRRTYSHFLMADTPGSPTWPYNHSQTKRISSFRNWLLIGPVFRKVEAEEIAEVRARLALNPGIRVCVFTMGGGGEQASGDALRFVAAAVRIAEQLRSNDPNCRLIFIRGPYFPQGINIPDLFEQRHEEPNMPALLQLAKAAVIRPGFNTTWECIQGRTPFFPVLSTAFAEPILRRIARMRCLGLIVPEIMTAWTDGGCRERFEQACDKALARCSGGPSEAILATISEPTLVVSPMVSAPSRHDIPENLIRDIRTFKRGKNLLIRVDDVANLNRALSWLLDLFKDLNLHASLEVIPYLSSLRASDLFIDRRNGLFEVAQHGYSHLPRFTHDQNKSEFSVRSNSPPEAEVIELKTGIQMMQGRFGDYFTGGWSAPFDSVPDWLGPLWRDLGGRFVSVISARPRRVPIPVVRVATDLCRWRATTRRTAGEILQQIAYSFATQGYAGLVIRPGWLDVQHNPDCLAYVLQILMECGVSSIGASRWAHFQSERTALLLGRECQRPVASPSSTRAIGSEAQ
jgi:hypothetical protein